MRYVDIWTDGACKGNPGGYDIINYKKFGYTTKNSYI